MRSSLALSILTQQPIQFINIRAGRPKPGLAKQHLTCVQAAAAISDAKVEGAAIGSTEVSFSPGKLKSGRFNFDIGSAGSASLVLQTVLVPLLLAGAPSEVTIIGGTHNMLSPPYEFLHYCFLPQLAAIGAKVEVVLEKHGFFPAGGGKLKAIIHPLPESTVPLKLLERGALKDRSAVVKVASMPQSIGKLQADKLKTEAIGLKGSDIEIQRLQDSAGPGNVVYVLENVSVQEERGRERERCGGEHLRQRERERADEAQGLLTCFPLKSCLPPSFHHLLCSTPMCARCQLPSLTGAAPALQWLQRLLQA